jgi:hypothetical protein
MLVPREFSKVPDQWHFAPILDTGEFVFLSGITPGIGGIRFEVQIRR